MKATLASTEAFPLAFPIVVPEFFGAILCLVFALLVFLPEAFSVYLW